MSVAQPTMKLAKKEWTRPRVEKAAYGIRVARVSSWAIKYIQCTTFSLLCALFCSSSVVRQTLEKLGKQGRERLSQYFPSSSLLAF